MTELKAFYGDIHNHCGISYGHGPLADALANARMQLDFASVTGHALWPDMPRHKPGMERRVAYHDEGFQKLASGWNDVVRQIQEANREGEFVTFLSYEMHCCAAGDYTVFYRDGRGEVLRTDSVGELHSELARLRAEGIACMAIPHHIGYPTGFRGINWEMFDGTFSPVVEMMSMHGCADGDDAPYPYLHTMGPCDHASTVGAGLAMGHVFGLVGSTDHHSAHPGSHGRGRLAVWAPALTREAIWDAIAARRTVALTGDRIALRFTVNDAFIGDVPDRPADKRRIDLSVHAGGAIERVEVLKNEHVLHRRFWAERAAAPEGIVRAKVGLEVGWGSRGHVVDWDVRLGVEGGVVVEALPRFKGPDVVAPDAPEVGCYRCSHWERDGERGVHFTTRTTGNPTTFTNANQGFGLEIEAAATSDVILEVNGHVFRHRLAELLAGARGGYVDGYGTPAYRLAAALPEEYEWSFALDDRAEGAPLAAGRDVYRVRVAQKNGQWAWSSPIWVPR